MHGSTVDLGAGGCRQDDGADTTAGADYPAEQISRVSPPGTFRAITTGQAGIAGPDAITDQSVGFFVSTTGLSIGSATGSATASATGVSSRLRTREMAGRANRT